MSCAITIDKKRKTVRFDFKLTFKHLAREKTDKANHAVVRREWEKLESSFRLGECLKYEEMDNRDSRNLENYMIYELLSVDDFEKNEGRKNLLELINSRIHLLKLK